MQSSNIPSKIPLPFGYAAGSGYINPIPTASQIGIVNGRASLHDGFPPDTFTPVTAGGVPPFGGDFNGILNEITAIQQWQEAGGFFPFDAGFAATIGGYPKGAILQSSTFNGLWVSTIENNSNNPDTVGTGWVSFGWEGISQISFTGTSVTLTPLQAAYPIINIQGNLTANSTLIVPNQINEWIFLNNTTGGYTLTVKTAGGVGITLNQYTSTYAFCDAVNGVYFADSSKVASFNGRVGTISLNSTDVTNALGYIPVNPNQFPFSANLNGYQQFPGGLIMQWCNLGFTGPSSIDITLPIAFPNAILSAVVGLGDNSGQTNYAVGYAPQYNTGSSKIRVYNNQVTPTATGAWAVVFGY